MGVSSLAMGATSKVEFSFPVTQSGTHTFVVFADSFNSVAESDEANNSNANNLKTVTVNVLPGLYPDLVLGNVLVEIVGSRLKLTTSVQNSGAFDAGAFGVGVKTNNFSGTLLSHAAVNGLAKTVSVDVPLDFTVDLSTGLPAPGTISFAETDTFVLNLFVMADDADRIPETSESNNSRIVSITLSRNGTIVDQNQGPCTQNCGPGGTPGTGGTPGPGGSSNSGGSIEPGSLIATIFGDTLGNGTIYDVLAGGLNAVFLGAPGILAPWEFLLLLILALIAAYLSFRISPRVLFVELLVLEPSEERKRLLTRTALALLFFFIPFGVSVFSFAGALAVVLLEIIFWPIAEYFKNQAERIRESKELTLE